MNRSLTALYAALEALLVVGIGVGIPLVPLTLLWAFQYGLQIDWSIFWRAAVDIWLLGSGVDVTMTLAPSLASALGFAQAGKPFVLTIALLGFALLTVLLGARAGRRIGETSHRLTGAAAAVGAFAVLSLAVTVSALWPTARASIWQGTLLPTLTFAIGVAIGLELGRRRSRPASTETERRMPPPRFERMNPLVRGVASAALRAGSGAVAMVIGVGSILLAILLLANYAKVIALYESIHAGVLGGIAITIGQLAVLPNMVVWCCSWLIGPGFALGTGSAISPVGTALGPIPAIPLLGALPSSTGDWGFLGLIVPVVAGFLAGVLARSRVIAAAGQGSRGVAIVASGIAIGIVAGVLLGLVCWASAGSAGPGRLIDVGPSPILVGCWAALEIGLASLIGLATGGTRAARDASA